MKIESSNSQALSILKTNAPRSTSSVDATGAAGSVQQTSAASSTVSLSSMSALSAVNGSDIDVAKVAAIKASLRDGTYKIDSSKIADGMINSARDMLQTTSR
jgi:negative regulator of flagellin synthesis FlgM